MNFEEYLKKKRLKERTIYSHKNVIKEFKIWIDKENLKEKYIQYKHILAFIANQKKSHKNRTINVKLNSIRHYFNYLLEIRKVKNNPALGIILKGVPRRIPHNILSEEELQNIYDTMKEETITDKRDKVIVGFVVFLGIVGNELERIRVTDVDLKKGTVYIRSSSDKNERKLRLESYQIINLHEYLTEVRPIYKKAFQKETDLLFIFKGKTLRGIIDDLLRKVRKRHPEIESFKQLRSSVIVNWLKRENLRIVQYKAGHKYVSSTERYKTSSLQELKRLIEEFHPLN